jgi:prefoldin subunit 5
MNDEQKSKEQLLQEVQVLHQRVAVLEAAQTEHQQIEEALRSAKEYAETLQRYKGAGLGLLL